MPRWNLRKKAAHISYSCRDSDEESDGEDGSDNKSEDEYSHDDSNIAQEFTPVKIRNNNKNKRNRKSNNNDLIYQIGNSQKRRQPTNKADDQERIAKKTKLPDKEVTDDSGDELGKLVPLQLMPGEQFDPVTLEDEVISAYFKRKFPESNNHEFSCIFCKAGDSRSEINTYSYHALFPLIKHYAKYHKDIPMSDFNVKCDDCGMLFYHERSLLYHQQSSTCSAPILSNNKEQVESDDVMKICKHCGIVFLSLSRYKKHLLSSDEQSCKFRNVQHPSEMGQFDYMKCKYCKKNFIDKSQFDNHLIPYLDPLIHMSKSYEFNVIDMGGFKCRNVSKMVRECILCNTSFLELKKFALHMKNDHSLEELGYKCDQCGSNFQNSSRLNSHVNTNKFLPKCVDLDDCRTIPAQPDSEEILTCPVCNKKIKYMNEYGKREYSNHVRYSKCAKSCYFEENWKCKKCNKVMYSQRDYDTHITEWKCPLCSMLFTRKNLLRNHFRSHQDPKKANVVCDIKGCKFTGHLPSNLKQHYKNDHYKAACPLCDTQAKGKEKMFHHLRIHLPSSLRDNFTCATCNRVFKNYTSLYRHDKISHQNKERFKCDFCEKDFAQVDTMKRHRRIHLNIKPFECDICHLSFTQNTGMKAHRNRHYNEDGSVKSLEEIKHQVKVIIAQRNKQRKEGK